MQKFESFDDRETSIKRYSYFGVFLVVASLALQIVGLATQHTTTSVTDSGQAISQPVSLGPSFKDSLTWRLAVSTVAYFIYFVATGFTSHPAMLFALLLLVGSNIWGHIEIPCFLVKLSNLSCYKQHTVLHDPSRRKNLTFE